MMIKILKLVFFLCVIPVILSATTTTLGKEKSQIIPQPDPDLIYSFDTLFMKYVNDNELNQPVIEVWVNISFNETGLQKIIEQRKDQKIPTEIFNKLGRIMSKRLLAENRRMRLVQDILYAKDGSMLGTLGFPKEWQEITPSSVDETIYDSVMVYVAKNEKTLKKTLK